MIIVYGGSFDPPHIGHCGIVSQLKKTYPFAFRIYIVPNFISPFKTDKSLSKEIIWKLCSLTFQEYLGDKIQLLDIEIKSKQTSYTFNTIKHIKTIYPDEDISLCFGEDSLKDLKQWFQFKELNDLVETYIILRRYTRSPNQLTFPDSEIELKSDVLSNELWDVSSTRLRNDRELDYAKRWIHPSALSYLKSIDWFDSNENN